MIDSVDAILAAWANEKECAMDNAWGEVAQEGLCIQSLRP